MANLSWLPSALRAAGFDVVEVGDWRNVSRGTFNPIAVVLHHDASARGDSPGVPAYMQTPGNNGAQIWIDRYGKIYMVGNGLMWQAGAATEGRAGIPYYNWNALSVGIETDHTTGEDWPEAQYNAMVGCAGILLAGFGQNPNRDRLVGHKEIQAGNPDPDGVDMNTFRQQVAVYMATGGLPYGDDDLSWTDNLPELDDNFNAQQDKQNPAWVYLLVNWRLAKQMKAEIDEIKAKVGAGPNAPAVLSDADVSRIAEAVANLIQRRLES